MSSKKQLQQFPKSTIVELREQNKSSQNTLDSSGNRLAGDYETKLNKTLYIEPGDQVEVASAFIDTASNTSGLIILNPDTEGGNTTTVSLDFGYYITNTPMSAETGKAGSAVEVCRNFFRGGAGGSQNAQGDATTEIDGEKYIACHRVQHALNVLTGSVTGVDLFFTPNVDPLANNTDSQYQVNISSNYVDTGTGKVVSQKQHITFNTSCIELLRPFMQGGTEPQLFLDAAVLKDLSTIKDKTGMSLIAQSTLSFPFRYSGGAANEPKDDGTIWGAHNNPTGKTVPNDGFQKIEFRKTEVDGIAESRPIIQETATIVIPSGHYSAEEITTQISTQLTRATGAGAVGDQVFDVVNNPLLTNINQLRTKIGGGAVRFVRTDGLREFEFVSTPGGTERNFVLGTSQFGLNYDEGDMRVEITSQHASLFNIDNADQAGQPEIRAYKSVEAHGTSSKFYADSYGGIIILKMTPNNLWTEQFKFKDLVATPQMQTIDYDPLKYSMPTFTGDNALVVGKNITSDMTGIDTSILKVLKLTGTKITQSYDTPFEFPTAPAFLGILVNDTSPILASGSINDGSHGEETLGYYQLEIDFGVATDIQGKDQNTNKIQSIVSRYYQSGSFTSAYNEGSFAYIHPPTAAPLAINSFKVRILQPDNTLANDISSNNSIFLKIIKNNNNL